MSIATGLIAKLLLALSVIPAAGYGGYCAYDHYNPTFHNRLIQQGFLFSPINGDLGTGEDFGKRREEIEGGGDWRCTKQLFEEMEAPASVNKAREETETRESTGIPTASSETVSSSTNDSVGCLVADLGYVKDANKKGGFLKWELALRSGNKGFIYVGYFSIGKIKDKSASVKADYSGQSASTVFEVSKENGKAWEIKHGLHWTDFLTSESPYSSVNNFDNTPITVSLANKHTWNSNGTICGLSDDETYASKCGDKNQWEFKRYVGFWEQGTSGDQVTDAIKIEVEESGKKYQHDIWSKTDFDFSSSNHPYVETSGTEPSKTTTTYLAWDQVSDVYDASTKKWKTINPGDGKSYLTSIYKPWAKKKGNWMEAEGVCYESNNRFLKEADEEAKRLLKFCYQNKK